MGALNKVKGEEWKSIIFKARNFKVFNFLGKIFWECSKKRDQRGSNESVKLFNYWPIRDIKRRESLMDIRVLDEVSEGF